MPQPPTKKILPAGPTSLIRTIDFDLLCRQFRCFLFLYFLYKKAIRNLRKIWKQFENFTFNFRQNLFRESTSFNKEHKFLVQCHLKTGIHCFVASTEVGFSLQEDIGFNFLTKFLNQSSKFTLCLNLNHFFGLVFSEKIYQCSLVVLEAISLKLKCLVRNAPKTPMEINLSLHETV